MNKNLPFVSVISKTSEAYASSGAIHSYVIASFPNYKDALTERWTLFSNGKMSSWRRIFVAKLWWESLSSLEQDILYRCPLILRDKSIYLGLKAKALGIPHLQVRERLEILTQLGYIDFLTRQHFKSAYPQVKSFLKKEWSTLKRKPKYSGYTRHYKDQGSLREKIEIFPEILDTVTDVEDDFLLHFILVGEFPTGYLSPMMGQRSRNEKFNLKLIKQ